MTISDLNKAIGGVSKDKILGYIVSWNLKGIAVKGTDLRNLFQQAGLDDKKYVRDIISRNIFLRAIKQLEEDRLIRKVSETTEAMIYQFTKEFLDKNRDILQYQFETKLTYNKDTKTVDTEEPALLTRVQNLIGICESVYGTSDITRFVQQIFRKEGDILSLRDGGSLYFVPIGCADLLERVRHLLNGLSGANTLKAYPILKVDDTINDIKKSFTDEGKEIIDKVKAELDEIKKLAADKNGKHSAELKAKNRIEKLIKLSQRAQLYGKLLEFQFGDVNKAIDETKKALNAILTI